MEMNEAIRFLRMEAGLTQAELAQKAQRRAVDGMPMGERQVQSQRRGVDNAQFVLQHIRRLFVGNIRQ